ncbi:MAG: hypothetical protein JKY82_05565 [Rhizobiaceae bacterium]|nr:hypothetical protein [Rhizobiaceae bacterium]
MIGVRELCRIAPELSVDYVRLLVRDGGNKRELPVFYPKHISRDKPIHFSFEAAWLFFLALKISQANKITFAHACRICQDLDHFNGATLQHQVFEIFHENAILQDLCLIYTDPDQYSLRGKTVEPKGFYKIDNKHVGIFQLGLQNAPEEKKLEHAKSLIEEISGRENSIVVSLSPIRKEFLKRVSEAGFCFYIYGDDDKGYPIYEITTYADWVKEWSDVDKAPLSQTLLKMLEGDTNA